MSLRCALMTIEIEVRSFKGRYVSANSPRVSYPVQVPEVVSRAITVGGFVSGSRYQRTMRRSSIANMVLSSVHVCSNPKTALATTELYNETETTEKTGVSFRLGMAFAAVAGSRVLEIKIMKHVRPRGGGGGRRADLVGMDRQRRWHVMEAKSRTYGIPPGVIAESQDPGERDRCRAQFARAADPHGLSLPDRSLGTARVRAPRRSSSIRGF